MTMQLLRGFAVCKNFLEWGLLRFHEQVLHDLRKWLHHAVWERKKNRKIMKNIVKFFKTPCLQNYENIEDVLEIKQLITRG